MDIQESEPDAHNCAVLRQHSLRRASNIQDVLRHLAQSPTRDQHQPLYSPPSRASADHDSDAFSPSSSSWTSLPTSPPAPGSSLPSPPPTSPTSTSPFKNRIGQTVSGAFRK